MKFTTFFVFCTPLIYALTLYCPSSNDLQVAYTGGSISIVNQGWTISGGGGVASKSSYNLLGGWIAYTIDFNKDQIGVNGNIYSISPTYHGGSSSAFNKGSDYCDGQGSGSTWCVEVDYIETNGFCGGASALHTVQGGGANCGAGGCASSYAYGSGGGLATSTGSAKFTMNISFSTSGVPTIKRAGSTIGGWSPAPLSSDYSALASAYANQGATLYSSLWTGWVPQSGCGTSGSLSASSFTVSGLQIFGTKIQGPTPTLCSGSPSPPATSPPSPPSTCNFNVNLAGKQCRGLTQKTGITSQSACQSACCSTSGCKVYQWFASNSQCWIGSSTTKLTTSNCPASSASFVSFATAALTSAAEESTSPIQQNYPYIIVGAVVLVVLIVAIVFTLRLKNRKRGQSVNDYAVEDKPTEDVPLESPTKTSSLSVLPKQESPETQLTAPIAAAATTNADWVARVDETNGQTYYYDNVTGATQWETPDGFTAPTATES